MQFISSLRRFLHSQRGVTAIEYGILAAGLALVIGALVAEKGVFSVAIDEIFRRIITNLPKA